MWAVSMKKPFFVGQRSLRILQARGPRQVLVGIEITDRARMPQRVPPGDPGRRHCRAGHQHRALAQPWQGDRPRDGCAGTGARRAGDLSIRGDARRDDAGAIVPTPFYDPKNVRQKAAASRMSALLLAAARTGVPLFGCKGAARGATGSRRRASQCRRRRTRWTQRRGGRRAVDGARCLIVARLGASEFFLRGCAPASAARGAAAAAGGIRPASIRCCARTGRCALSGARLHEVLAQVCNVNFAALASDSRPVIMTLMIGVAVLVVPQGDGGAASGISDLVRSDLRALSGRRRSGRSSRNAVGHYRGVSA